MASKLVYYVILGDGVVCLDVGTMYHGALDGRTPTQQYMGFVDFWKKSNMLTEDTQVYLVKPENMINVDRLDFWDDTHDPPQRVRFIEFRWKTTRSLSDML